ncbi:Helicase-associated domain [Arabidopsis thaliana x Arabidopsis arenosa]|uniref:RNA helicase n=1 Tax=Arabidopsis thaliana x Arabidopsis arenosa TaxID=1240361 RepID=A0A8T2C7H1_9BRAS|nr:Helicase-associated domain [Arabidopsis thaliana x Arabidopsis arenosa]
MASLMGDDCNLDIMPPRKKNQGSNKDKLNSNKKTVSSRCRKRKLNSNKDTVVSKSQKRKLKKLEEDKEKEIIFAKTAELLDTYKISEDVSSLLQSSKVIGRSATKLEKRRRAMQLSKAGVETEHSDESVEQNDDDDSCMDKPTTPEHVEIEIPTFVTDSEQQLVHDHELGSDLMISAEETSSKLVVDDTVDMIPQTTCRDDEEGSLGMDGTIENEDVTVQGPRVPAFVVHVSRPAEVEETRKDLPIVMMEQEIMEAINRHPAVIISGQTGCGKTTQVPQFLYEAGFGSKQFSSRSGIIGITQPRRVAVLATAKRVAFELGVRLGKEVGFQVRYDKKIGENSSIKFMTDGILLREIQNDFLLRRYSVIILDEAHERSLNTDILIGMLTRVIKIRQEYYEEQQKSLQSGGTVTSECQITPLKLILMSATLRVEDFVSGKRLFPNIPPLIEVPTRQYPVTIHFSRKTEIVDYIGQAYKKVMSIHKKLPQGGILVFVTGQREVDHLCEKLRKSSKELVVQAAKRDAYVKKRCDDGSFGGVDMKEIAEAFDDGSENQNYRFSSHGEDPSEIGDGNYDDDFEEEDMYESDEDRDWETVDDDFASSFVEEGKLDALRAAFNGLADKNGSVSAEPAKTIAAENQAEQVKNTFSPGKLRVLPLYAMLSPAAQLRVFEEFEKEERLVVVATNVAETSLTIPGIKYVVDTGRVKVKNYDSKTGMESYEVDWISQASASQRAGRAGRTGPGHCYRLYSSAVFSNIFEESSPPEITKVPVDGVVLLMKSMNIPKVENFPFPTPPEPSAIREAERCLKALEALDSNGRLTPLGKAMSHYPMSPRHSRMLLSVIQMLKEARNYSRANLVLGYAVAAVAALSLPNPLIMEFEGEKKNESKDADKTVKQEDKQRRKDRKEKIKAARDRFSNPSSDALTVAYALHSFEVSENGMGFCEANGLHLKTMDEMSKLKDQLLRLVFSCCKPSETDDGFSWTHGTIQDVEKSWRITTSSSSKYPLLQNEEELLGEAICAGWADRVARKTRATEYQACAVQEPVFLHRWSSLINTAPELLVYSELLLTNRPYMHGATRVKPEWLVKHAKSLCVFSAPLKDPKPYYSSEEDRALCWVVPSFGPHNWELPAHSVAITEDRDRAAAFGCALLQGEVLPCLKSVRTLLAGKPETLLEREAWGLERVGGLVMVLTEKKIDSLESLRKSWEQNPKVLYSEIEVWFQKKFRHRVKDLWQTMLKEAHVQRSQRR